MAEFSTFTLGLGSRAPDFGLPGTDGKDYALKDFEKSPLLLVVFSCNHCPYAVAWENRLIEIGRDYASRGVAMVVINPNDAVRYPDDSFERMKDRAREKHFPYHYLRDDSQEVAHAYGALVTPHVYLFDRERRLIYQGTVDDNWKAPHQVTRRYLREAIEAALSNKSPPLPTTPVLGCSVKWKPET